jgi:hypothetical protein
MPDAIAVASVSRDRVHVRTQPIVVVRSAIVAELRFLLRQRALCFLQALLFVRQLLLQSAAAFGVVRRLLAISRSGRRR